MLDYIRRRKKGLAKARQAEIAKTWEPLRHIQAEEDAVARSKALTAAVEAIEASEAVYRKWRDEVVAARQSLRPDFTPRGNSFVISSGGITARGNADNTPHGYAAVFQVAAGANHVALVHQSGQLYTWGLGGAGRLGLDVTERGDPRGPRTEDTRRPTPCPWTSTLDPARDLSQSGAEM